jgi:hypothetical protein
MKTVKETETVTPEIKNLLFQKEFLEYKIPELIEGINAYDEAIKFYNDLKGDNEPFYKVNSYELKSKAQNLAVQLRYYYQNHKTVVDNLKGSGIDIDEIKEEQFYKNVLDIFETEIYGSATFLTSEKELPKVIGELENYVELLKNKLSHLESFKTPLTEVDIYNTKRHILCLQKRILERKKYYTEQFLPIYESDMKQCRKLFDKYMKRGKVFADANLDPTLGFIIKNHENNKANEKDLWVFWKALKSRVDSIIEQLEKQRDTLPSQFLNYLIPIK